VPWSIKAGLTKVGNQAKPIKYSVEQLYFHTNLEKVFKHTATDLNKQPTTTKQRLMCDSTMTGCRRLNDTGSKITALMWPHRKKSIGVTSGNLGDQATGLPRPIQQLL
jgi:hypothetical protein